MRTLGEAPGSMNLTYHDRNVRVEPSIGERRVIEIGFTLRAGDVVAAMNRLKYSRGLPQRISCDNGSEFSGGQMDFWAYSHQVQMDFNRRGKPTDNATVESFNGKFREECLNAHWFESIEDARKKIDAC